MSRQGGLGRGLSSLIPADVQNDENATFQTVPVSAIEPNRYQPREHFDEETLDALTKSVRELGVLQPLLVRRDGDTFELIAGERRWRAAKRAGLQEVPVILRDANDHSSLEQALVENLHRQDLNALEEAAAYQQLVEEFSMKQDEVAKRVGKSRSAVANTLRLLSLPTSVQRFVAEGRLSAGHARAVLGLDNEPAQLALSQRIVDENLTVRQVEDLLRPQATGAEDASGEGGVSHDDDDDVIGAGSVGRTKDPALLELESLLSEQLDTRVSVSMGAKRGKIAIDFADLDDLERIYRVIQS